MSSTSNCTTTVSSSSIRLGRRCCYPWTKIWMKSGWKNLYEKQLKKSSVMKNALSLYHSDILPNKETKSHKRLRSMVNDILEDQKHNPCNSHKERSRGRAATAYSSKVGEGKSKHCRSWPSKGSCSKGSTCSFEQKKVKVKGQRSRSSAPRGNALDTCGIQITRTARCLSGKEMTDALYSRALVAASIAA